MFRNAISSCNAPKAIGPYSCAMKLGDFVYISGQLPIDASSGNMPETIEEQTKQSLANIEALLAEMFLEPRHVVKTTIYMSDLSEFSRMNEVYGQFFSEPYPARSCVEVKALPKGAKVEIECFAIDTLALENIQGCCGGNCNDENSCQCDMDSDNCEQCCNH